MDIISVGVDRMQRNFEPMRKQVEAWKGSCLPDESAKLVIYKAFVEGGLEGAFGICTTQPSFSISEYLGYFVLSVGGAPTYQNGCSVWPTNWP